MCCPRAAKIELLRYLADLSPVGLIQADADGRFTYANARWCQMTGYPRETALGLGWDQVVHPEDAEAVREAWTRMREYGVPFSLEFRYLQPDGQRDLGMQPGDGIAGCAGAGHRLSWDGHGDHGGAADARGSAAVPGRTRNAGARADDAVGANGHDRDRFVGCHHQLRYYGPDRQLEPRGRERIFGYTARR